MGFETIFVRPTRYRDSDNSDRSSLSLSPSTLNCSSSRRNAATTSATTTNLRLRPGNAFLVCLCLSVLCGVVSSNTVASKEECLQLFDTHQQGVYVCDNHLDLVQALRAAEMIGREQCEKSFAGEKWNCSGFSILKAPNITSRATIEAAYVHALSLAAIAHSVAKMCAIGDVTSCDCSQTSLELPTGSEERHYTTGCSDNVSFGIEFATQFLHKRQTGNGNKQMIERDNMAVGARCVREVDRAPYICRCIGVSGSCSLQRCQHELPEFHHIADLIFREYSPNSTCVANWNGIVGENSELVVPSGCENKLVYSHRSPNYCTRDPSVGALGTMGRECDPHSTGSNSCRRLCSDCGYGNTEVVTETESDCLCEFIFCCEIRCSKCQERRRYHVCSTQNS